MERLSLVVGSIASGAGWWAVRMVKAWAQIVPPIWGALGEPLINHALSSEPRIGRSSRPLSCDGRPVHVQERDHESHPARRPATSTAFISTSQWSEAVKWRSHRLAERPAPSVLPTTRRALLLLTDMCADQYFAPPILPTTLGCNESLGTGASTLSGGASIPSPT
jgi:hypothetical protein